MIDVEKLVLRLIAIGNVLGIWKWPVSIGVFSGPSGRHWRIEEGQVSFSTDGPAAASPSAEVALSMKTLVKSVDENGKTLANPIYEYITVCIVLNALGSGGLSASASEISISREDVPGYRETPTADIGRVRRAIWLAEQVAHKIAHADDAPRAPIGMSEEPK